MPSTLSTSTASKSQLPFTLGSSFTTRQAFTVSNQALGSGTVQPANFPLNLGSFGWVSNVLLDITVSYTAGSTAPTLGPDGFDALIDRIGVSTSGGSPLIQPVDGFTLHMDNVFGGKRFGAANLSYGTDPDTLPGTDLAMPAALAAKTNRFFRSLQFEIDPSTALASIPATAANREFTISLTLASLSTLFASNAPAAATVSIVATVFYWDLPADGAMPFGSTASSQTLRLLQTQQRPMNQGDSDLKSTNVGNVIMSNYLIFRDSSGVRSDADFSDPFQIEVDNNVRFWISQDVWKASMAAWFGLTGALDSPGGLYTGVYVLPWRLLAGGTGANANASHAQYLATLDTTNLVFHGLNFGAAGSLQVVTDTVSTPQAAYLYSK